MFHYERYKETEFSTLRKFIIKNPLATLMTIVDGAWQCSHVPFFFDKNDNKSKILLGHVDVRNPQFLVENINSAYLIFGGQNSYIPPEAYASIQLPTWNYLSVHVRGNIELIHDEEINLEILKNTANCLDGFSDFKVLKSDSRIGRWISGICGLKVSIAEIEGRFKLSQDKSVEDITSAANYFVENVTSSISRDYLLALANKTSVSKD